MKCIKIMGGNTLKGEISLQGAKNSALPILAATLLCNGESVLHNCPDITDVDAAINILVHLGASVIRDDKTVIVDTGSVNCMEIPDSLMREMRSSIVFLGAIISRCKSALLSFPGGCELGPRPIDIHLMALRKMGVTIEESGGKLWCYIDGELTGAEITLPISSVGATENIILAAVLAKGETVIRNAAREPEIIDLANYLNSAGAKIYGAGDSTVTVCGVDRLNKTEHTVIPDRIVAATYMSAVAVSGGEVLLNNVNREHLHPVVPAFLEAGCELDYVGNSLYFNAPKKLKPVGMIRTGVYPGFPTDAQPPVLSMAAFADGTSVFVENIFENRFKHVGELVRMSANVRVEGKVAVVEGSSKLNGAKVDAGDLRGGAALVVAGIGAVDITEISGVDYINRGYENIVENLKGINANICLVDK